MNRTLKKIIKGLLLSIIISLFCSNAIAQSELCVNKACLGMTLEEASKLPLSNASALKLEVSENRRGVGDFGVDFDGKRVYFVGDVIDKSIINLLKNNVKTICSPNTSFQAKLLASDGEPITLFFGPTAIDGAIKWTVQRINRKLPAKISKSELEKFKEEAKNRYGEYWIDRNGKDWNKQLNGPSVSIGVSLGIGQLLILETPYKRINTMEQKGCSDKLSID
ncbi:hypothetical protein [Deefgea sp. CFH1-16]|uniref:hypothetical protein n=1 Tax=Deefgea sp. CFH1-16 TaxID=2675457 RepID=UPI0015F3A51D|nr:hypothetical protein [Deefgea sp. CFH1-16]MBM5574509.1 hypothetical protein [Deefgea sp. CFH1-16]